jgi:hypothetical protein
VAALHVLSDVHSLMAASCNPDANRPPLPRARARARERSALTVCTQVVERKDPSEKPGAGGLEGGVLQEGQRFITDQTELPPRSEL